MYHNTTISTFFWVRHVLSTGWPICIWTILWGYFEVTGWLKIEKFNSSEKFMQIPLKVNKIYFLWHQAWPHNDLRLLKTKTLKLRFLIFILLVLKMLKIPNFYVTLFEEKWMAMKYIFCDIKHSLTMTSYF